MFDSKPRLARLIRALNRPWPLFFISLFISVLMYACNKAEWFNIGYLLGWLNANVLWLLAWQKRNYIAETMPRAKTPIYGQIDKYKRYQ